MSSLLRMRRALLTGVGREGQVGEVVADRLASDGFELFLVDRAADRVEARAASLRQRGYKAVGRGCDLTDADAVARLFRDLSLAEGQNRRATASASVRSH